MLHVIFIIVPFFQKNPKPHFMGKKRKAYNIILSIQVSWLSTQKTKGGLSNLSHHVYVHCDPFCSSNNTT